MQKRFIYGVAALLAAIAFSASAQVAYTTRTVNVRAGPDTSYPPISALAPGASVQVMGCLDDWSWCDVTFGPNRGWVYAPYLNYLYEGSRVPFYSYAPAFGIPIVTFAIGPYWDNYYRGRDFYARRGYWAGRTYTHVRPPGPAPVRVIPPSYRTGRPEFHTQQNLNVNRNVNVNRDVNVNRNVTTTQNVNVNKNVNANRNVNANQNVNVNKNVNASHDHKSTQAVNTGKPPPTAGHPQAAPPATMSRNAPQGQPQSKAPPGKEHEGNKEEHH
jgi:uncharacterized protein YraI